MTALHRPPSPGLARWWWTFILRGIVAIAFGVLALWSPAWGMAVLVALFAGWAIVDGTATAATGIRTRREDRSWWLEILEGLVGIAAGVIAVLLPIEIAARTLVLVIAAWAGLTGAIQIVLAIRLRRVIRGELWMALAGLASIFFGAVLVLFPAAGALSLVWLIGAFAVAFGTFAIGLGWRLRSLHERVQPEAVR